MTSADRVVFISDTVKQESKMLYPHANVSGTVVHSLFRSKANSDCCLGFRERLSKGQFLSVGGRFRHKNLDCLLKAFAFLKRNSNTGHLRLVLVGVNRSLWWREYGGFEGYPFPNDVDVMEYVSDEVLEKAYEESIAFIFPTMAEGMGLPPLEALQHGCLPIVNDLPVLREVCDSAALYFDGSDPHSLYEKMRQILDNNYEDDYNCMIGKGLLRLKLFGKDSIKQRWDEEFNH